MRWLDLVIDVDWLLFRLDCFWDFGLAIADGFWISSALGFEFVMLLLRCLR